MTPILHPIHQLLLHALRKISSKGQILQTLLSLLASAAWAQPDDFAKTKAAAESGNAESQLAVGAMYAEGRDIAKDQEEASKWFHKAAEQGNARGQLKLAKILLPFGQRDPKKDAEAAQWCRKAADQALPDAEYLMGNLYSGGVGVPQDFQEAAKWYSKAAATGHTNAVTSLIPPYDNHILPPNPQELAKLYRVGADQGDPLMGPFYACRLAAMYAQGEGVTQDLDEAQKWYHKVSTVLEFMKSMSNAPPGFAKALARPEFYIGRAFYSGSGPSRNCAEAFAWLRKAASNGDKTSHLLLWRMYTKGDCIPKNPAEAARCLVNLGSALTTPTLDSEGVTAYLPFLLAQQCADGRGLPQSFEEAAAWSRLGADHGDPDCQLYLGWLYAKGQGVPQDAVEATKFWRLAADQGFSTAQFNLGLHYSKGKGVPQNDIFAYKWLTLAAAQAQTNAAALRDALAQRMARAEIVEAQRLAAAFVPSKHTPGDPASPDSSSPTPKATGTGFLVTTEGYLLSNFHVVKDASRISVKIGGAIVPAKLIKGDAAQDIALLKATGSFQAIPVVGSRTTKLGESVFTIGFPNVLLQGVQPKLTKGDVNALTGPQDDPRYFQISAPIQPGNSGGPLLNQFGNVVGIVTATLSEAAAAQSSGATPQNVNYAIKSSYILSFLESLPEVADKLNSPYPSTPRAFDDVAKEAQNATVLILVY